MSLSGITLAGHHDVRPDNPAKMAINDEQLGRKIVDLAHLARSMRFGRR